MQPLLLLLLLLEVPPPPPPLLLLAACNRRRLEYACNMRCLPPSPLPPTSSAPITYNFI